MEDKKSGGASLSPHQIAPVYCDGAEIRSRSGRKHTVAKTDMTGETKRDP